MNFNKLKNETILCFILMIATLLCIMLNTLSAGTETHMIEVVYSAQSAYQMHNSWADTNITQPSSEVLNAEEDVSETDKLLLAKIINAEAGLSWMSDEHKLLVGNVVLNRVESDRFPDTLYDVIYQSGQYACAGNGKIDKIVPSERDFEAAEQLLKGERFCPENVVFQSNFKQGGGVYKTIYDKILGTTTYFCYL